MQLLSDYELFCREFVREYETLAAQDVGLQYQFTNPKTVSIDQNDKSLNIKYFSGENIFDATENAFYKSNLQVMRKCVQDIETYLSQNNSMW